MNQVPCETVQDLETAIGDFVGFDNHRGTTRRRGRDAAPCAGGRRDAILARRKEVQQKTFQRRGQYYQQARDAT